MNRIIIKGRITKDLEIKMTQSNVEILKFTVAVQRNFKNTNGTYDADFIQCIAFKENAKFIKMYFAKGSEILIEGKLQTGSYDDKDGKKVYTTDVIIDKAYFCGSKNEVKEEKEEKVEVDVFSDFGKIVETDDNFLE